jgi:lysophospholipase L1-like esterase
MSSRVVIGDSILKNIRNINDCHIFSLSGASLDEISSKIDEILTHCPDAKTLLVHGGTNDLNNQSVAQIITKYEHLIDKFKSKYPNMSLQLSCILPRPGDNIHINSKLDQVNHLLRNLCVAKRCFYVASNKVFYRSGSLCPDLFSDGLHLSMLGTKRLRQFFCQRLSELGCKPANPFCYASYLRRTEWHHKNLSLRH